jgi:hypothetical protein
LEALIGLLLVFTWLIFTIVWVMTFIGPARRAIARGILAPYRIPLRRFRWGLGLSAVAAFVAVGIVASESPEEQSLPSTSATTAASPVAPMTPASAVSESASPEPTPAPEAAEPAAPEQMSSIFTTEHAVVVIFVIGFLITGIVKVGRYYNRKRREYLLSKYRDQFIVDKIMRHMIWQGMSKEQLLDSWGSPANEDQKIYKTKVTETFKYSQYGRNRFHNRVRLDNGIVVGWEKK